jgi:hypothetical protein
MHDCHSSPGIHLPTFSPPEPAELHEGAARRRVPNGNIMLSRWWRDSPSRLYRRGPRFTVSAAEDSNKRKDVLNEVERNHKAPSSYGTVGREPAQNIMKFRFNIRSLCLSVSGQYLKEEYMGEKCIIHYSNEKLFQKVIRRPRRNGTS